MDEERFYTLISQGLPPFSAAARLGVSREKLKLFLRDEKKQLEIDKAIGKFHEYLINTILEGSKKAPKVAYDLLTARFPEIYGKEDIKKENVADIIKIVKSRKESKKKEMKNG